MLLLAGGASGGCRPTAFAAVVRPDPASFGGSNALSEVARFLALGPRDGGTAASGKAAQYLATRLAGFGIAAEIDAFPDETPDGTSVFHNVIGRLPGTSTGIVVVAAHFDTKAGIPGFQGANDSGSGVGLLLALADWYRSAPPLKSALWLAFLDGEECRRDYGPHDGLHGSRRLARDIVDRGVAERVQAVVVLDMIGDRNLKVMLPRNGTPSLMAAVLKAAATEQCRPVFTLHPGSVLDDHQPFLDAGMPAVDLIDFEYGSAPGRNDYWHTAGDTLDKLSADSLHLVGRVVIRLLDDLSAQTASGSASTRVDN
jgi:Zn-dependent M28 family amino/carboxypeptidase